MVRACECMFPMCVCLRVCILRNESRWEEIPGRPVFILCQYLSRHDVMLLYYRAFCKHTHTHTHTLAKYFQLPEGCKYWQTLQRKRRTFGGMNESRMNGMWVSFSRCCKHLPASSRHFINPSPSLHPTPPLSRHTLPPNKATCLMFLFSVPPLVSFKCQVRYF